MLPLPPAVLQAISPAALATYRDFGNYPPGTYHAVSLNPYATRQALILFLSYAAVFFVVISHYRTKAQVKSLVKTILYMGVFLVIFAIVQKLTWNGYIYWIYPIDEALKSEFSIWAPFINRNHFAGYMEMAIPLGMGLLIYYAPSLKTLTGAPLPTRIAHFWARDKHVPATLLLLLVLIMTAALFMTFSRGGIMGFIVSAIFFTWITRKRRSLRIKTGMLAFLASMIFVAVIFAAWDRLEQRFADLDRGHVGRLNVFQDSLGIVKDYPAVGTGLGTFENAYMRYKTTEPKLLFDHAHNDYLELLTDTGIIGVLVASAMALFFFLSIFRRWLTKHSMFGKCLGAGGLSSCLAIAAHSFMDFNLHIPANALLFTVTAAITYAAVFNISGGKIFTHKDVGSCPPLEGVQGEVREEQISNPHISGAATEAGNCPPLEGAQGEVRAEV
ncbi:MAG: O-antigen ligase family protein [Deltaproteobacteria bacterium]|nr:O-antigen ligase family protein [Deltaproteobacteria bacterium]